MRKFGIKFKTNTMKNRPNRYSSDSQHRSYGIKSWLIGKGFCLHEDSKTKVDTDQYRELLKEFCLYDKPDFDLILVSHLGTYEQYVQNRFLKFCAFCIDVYYKN